MKSLNNYTCKWPLCSRSSFSKQSSTNCNARRSLSAPSHRSAAKACFAGFDVSCSNSLEELSLAILSRANRPCRVLIVSFRSAGSKVQLRSAPGPQALGGLRSPFLCPSARSERRAWPEAYYLSGQRARSKDSTTIFRTLSFRASERDSGHCGCHSSPVA